MTARRKTPLVALALFAIVPVCLAACSSGGDDDGGGGATGEGGAEAVESAGSGGSARANAAQAQADSSAGGLASSTLPVLGPRVIKTASLRLTVPRDRFEDAVGEARVIAAELGGFVVSSTAKQQGGRLVQGSLVVRVPARHYERAMGELGAIGRVDHRAESTSEVSQEFVDLESRARHLEAVERQLLEFLNRARTVSAALAVQSRLNETQLELEQVRGRLRFLDDQTSFATISLAIRERLPAAARPETGWGVVDAWRDGARAFVRVAGRAFVVLAAVSPLVVLAALVFLAARALRRRPLFNRSA